MSSHAVDPADAEPAAVTVFLDVRVPVLLDGCPTADDAVLAEVGCTLPPGAVPAAWWEPSADAHRPGCACCAGRSPAAMALAGLFAARARGGVPFFRRVVAFAATEAGRAELRAALEDPLVAGRYRAA